MKVKTFNELTEAQGQAICEKIWLQLENLDMDDAWSIIAIVMSRFIDETHEGARDHFHKWLEHTRPKHDATKH